MQHGTDDNGLNNKILSDFRDMIYQGKSLHGIPATLCSLGSLSRGRKFFFTQVNKIAEFKTIALARKACDTFPNASFAIAPEINLDNTVKNSLAEQAIITGLPITTTQNEVRKMFHQDVAQNIKEISIPRTRKDSKTSTVFITWTTKEQAIEATNYSPKDIEKKDFVAIITLTKLSNHVLVGYMAIFIHMIQIIISSTSQIGNGSKMVKEIALTLSSGDDEFGHGPNELQGCLVKTVTVSPVRFGDGQVLHKKHGIKRVEPGHGLTFAVTRLHEKSMRIHT